MGKLLLEEETYAIRGAAIEVHKTMGHGFLEAVYQETLEIELGDRNVPFEAQKALNITCIGRLLKKQYIADLVCFGSVLVEIKCIAKIGDVERAQLLNYLAATGIKVGLIINFGSRGKLEVERLVV
ncbi:MAG: GxxExxY protein [Planctomycetes bacterium]|nr:GxxExxY protein [Planctomycetota bacterium]